MTALISAPTTVSTADQIIETLATYVDKHSGDTGGGHQRTMLLAALIVRLSDVTPERAIDLARHDYWHPLAREASRARDEVLDRVRRAREAAEYGETPAAVTR